VIVNGYSVARTKSSHVRYPQFTAEVHQSIQLQLVRRPTSIQVEIWQEGEWYHVYNTLLATIPVMIPGNQVLFTQKMNVVALHDIFVVTLQTD
jgi:hypothetical protein